MSRLGDLDQTALVLQEFSNRYSPKNNDDDDDDNNNNNHNHNHNKIPLFAFGVSMGGAFVSQLAGPLQEQFGLTLTGFISQVQLNSKLIVREQLQQQQQQQQQGGGGGGGERGGPDLDCQVYSSMIRDARSDARDKSIVTKLNAKNSSNNYNNHNYNNNNNNNKAKHIRLPALAISSSYFSDRIPEVSVEQSILIGMALRQAGYFIKNNNNNNDNDNDSKRAILKEDPRQSNWRSIVSNYVPKEQDSLAAHHSPIAAVLNVAYGMHDTARDGVKEALQFCLQQPQPQPQRQPQKV